MHKITDEWLREFGTDGDAWTKDQLEAIGVNWPPNQGWKRRVMGTEITESNRQRFEAARNRKQAKAAQTLELF